VGPADYFDVHKGTTSWNSSVTSRDHWYTQGRGATPQADGSVSLNGGGLAMPAFDGGTFRQFHAEYDLTGWKEGTSMEWRVWARPQEKEPYQKVPVSWQGYRIIVTRKKPPYPIEIQEQYCRAGQCEQPNTPNPDPIAETCTFADDPNVHLYTDGNGIHVEVILPSRITGCDYTEDKAFTAAGGWRSRFGNVVAAGGPGTTATIGNLTIRRDIQNSGGRGQ
jgi:hypothetical protein